ncbi:MAG: right-handed parallel beta-helix repeat-containing protein [Saccharofermentanales bacterium]
MKEIITMLAIGLSGLLLVSCGPAGVGNGVPADSEFAFTASDISVMQNGAKGNNADDDTAAIEEAVSVASESNKRLFFDKGTYIINGNITIPSSTSVVFDEDSKLYLGKDAVVTFNARIIARDQMLFDGEGIVRINTETSGNPIWFGAKGDGISDDTSAFEKAFKSFDELALPFTEEGYVITSLPAFKNMSITSRDPGKRATIKASKDCERLIYAEVGEFKITHLNFDMADAKKYSTVLYFDTSKRYIEKIYVNNCTFTDAYNVFSDAKSSNVMMFMHFEDIECYRSRNSTFDIEDFEGFIFIKRFKVDNSESFTAHDLKDGFPFIYIENVRGTIFEDVEVIGGGSDFTTETGFLHPGNVEIGWLASVWWDRVKVSNTGGYGITIGKTLICSLVDTTVVNCGGGIKVDRSEYLQLERVTVKENKSKTPLETHGLYFLNCRMTQMNNVVSSGNSGSGIYLDKCSSGIINSSEITDNEGFGYIDIGGSQNILMGSKLSGNQKSQVSVASSGGRVDKIMIGRNKTPDSFDGVGKID